MAESFVSGKRNLWLVGTSTRPSLNVMVSEKYYSSHSKKHPHHAEGRCGEEIWEKDSRDCHIM